MLPPTLHAPAEVLCVSFTTFVLSFLPPLLLIIAAQMADTYIDPCVVLFEECLKSS